MQKPETKRMKTFHEPAKYFKKETIRKNLRFLHVSIECETTFKRFGRVTWRE